MVELRDQLEEQYAPVAEQIRDIADRFVDASVVLRDGQSNENDALSVRAVHSADGLKERHFHKIPHFLKVESAKDDSALHAVIHELGIGQELEKMQAMITRAAVHHDIVYYQFDHQFAKGVGEVLTPYITFPDPAKPDVISIQPQEEHDPLILKAVNTIFGFHAGQVLDPFNGQNEYLSALFAAEIGKKQGIPLKYILGEVALIESTVPFGAKNRLDLLENRLVEANRLLPEGEPKLTPEETQGILASAATLSNVDVRGIGGGFEEFHKGTIDLIREGGNHLDQTQASMRGINKQIGFLGFLLGQCQDGKKQIFHSYEYMQTRFLPPQETIDRWEARAQENIHQELQFLKALYVADAYLASEANRRGISPESTMTGQDMRVVRNLGDPVYAVFSSYLQDLPGSGLAVELMKHHPIDTLYKDILAKTKNGNDVKPASDIRGLEIPRSVEIYMRQNFSLPVSRA